jgi:hypothetical protein
VTDDDGMQSKGGTTDPAYERSGSRNESLSGQIDWSRRNELSDKFWYLGIEPAQ